MIEIPRTPGLEEPTYDEIVSRVLYNNELFLNLESDERAAIFGDERAEFLKNMALGLGMICEVGIFFTCYQPPGEMSAQLKENIDWFTSTAAWGAAGPLGLLVKHVGLAIRDSKKEKNKDEKKPSINEILSFHIPLVNIIGIEQIKILKGRFRKKELNGIKILTEKHDETKITFWMTTAINNAADIIFKLRYEEEKRLGVDNSQLSQFK